MPRYLGNASPSKMEVRDTQNEQTNCQLSEIKDKRWFNTLGEAHRAGYNNCHWCIGDSTR